MNSKPIQPCPGPVGRREFLKIGGLGLGALSGGFDPNLTRLLAGEQSPAGLNKDFSVILLWANGGPSHIDTFDMKPLAPQNTGGNSVRSKLMSLAWRSVSCCRTWPKWQISFRSFAVCTTTGMNTRVVPVDFSRAIHLPRPIPVMRSIPKWDRSLPANSNIRSATFPCLSRIPNSTAEVRLTWDRLTVRSCSAVIPTVRNSQLTIFPSTIPLQQLLKNVISC
ncbi:DUF1501 domain-containing protein [Gimesia benthica]|uniref:DUF1501 domain-containing protein n=1 Tax=Gimesia benthica TaxID=2608982 RepID=A0A6I6A811_9PLAN|nr:DUF1501 domain-containing protein [Gimesia benthica]